MGGRLGKGVCCVGSVSVAVGGVLAASDSVGRGCDEQEESIRAADRIAGISVFFMSVSSIIVVGGVFYLGNR